MAIFLKGNDISTYVQPIFCGGNAFNGQADGSRLSADGAIYASRSTGPLFGGYTTGSNLFTIRLDADGSIYASNNQTFDVRTSKGDTDSAYAVRLRASDNSSIWQVNADGDASLKGSYTINKTLILTGSGIDLGAIYFDTSDTTFKMTTGQAARAIQIATGNGSTDVPAINVAAGTGVVSFPNGTTSTSLTIGSLDVGDRLTKSDAALTAIKAAATDASTDLAGLKAAIVAALSNH